MTKREQFELQCSKQRQALTQYRITLTILNKNMCQANVAEMQRTYDAFIFESNQLIDLGELVYREMRRKINEQYQR